MVSFTEISGYFTKYGKYVFLLIFIASVIRALIKIRKTGCIQVLAEEALWPSITAGLFLVVMFGDDIFGWVNRKVTGATAISKEPEKEPEKPDEDPDEETDEETEGGEE